MHKAAGVETALVWFPTSQSLEQHQKEPSVTLEQAKHFHCFGEKTFREIKLHTAVHLLLNIYKHYW